MIRVSAPSRLHFGFLTLSAEESWPNQEGGNVLPARRYASVGLMVEAPGCQVAVQKFSEWSATGPLGNRALDFGRRFAGTFPPEVIGAHRIVVESASPEHVGLGTGTQLGLAVARALSISAMMPTLGASELARRIGRGARSAIGIHGFERGGFLADAGKRAGEDVAPLLFRVAFPQMWPILLILPKKGQGLHGPRELQALHYLENLPHGLEVTGDLCRLLLLGMLPALSANDWRGFSEALHDFNARVGRAFSAVQGGTFASPILAQIVASLRGKGVPGVGQSSWGPGGFAVAQDEEMATWLARDVEKSSKMAHVLVTRASNRGANVLEVESESL